MTVARATRVQREGSPWTGLWAVVAKEMADHLSSTRMHILEFLIALTAIGTVYSAASAIRSVASLEPKYLFLKLFTVAQEPFPSFVDFLGFLVPLIAIALAFDAVNSEFNQHTLARVLSQPIYRDALLMGKFLAGLFTQFLIYAAIWLLIFGLGVIQLGVPPTSEEVGRALWLLVATVFYGGVWMAVALLFSVRFRQPATAALASIALWLFFTVFWGMVATSLASIIAPIRVGLPEELLAQARWQLALRRVAPGQLYAEILVAMLRPEVRSLSIVLPFQLEGALLGQPLPLSQSVLLIWPHLTGLIAATLVLFALAYIMFQRQEVRA